MAGMMEEEPEEYAVKFAGYVKAGIDADNLEETYLKVHKAIRESPAHVATEKKKPSPAECAKCKADGGIRYTDSEGKAKFMNRTRRTLAQRKNRVAQKKAFVLSTLEGSDSDE